MELGVDLPLYLVYRGEQLFQPFGGQILRLNGNNDPVRSGQRIDREHPQGGLTVDEDMGVLPLQRVQILSLIHISKSLRVKLSDHREPAGDRRGRLGRHGKDGCPYTRETAEQRSEVVP